MKIPYVALIKQHQELKQELLETISSVLDSGYFILGNNVAEFENKMAELCQTKHAIGVNSGTDALILSLKVLGIGSSDEVITPANSFLASASAIVTVGAKPVLVDVNQDMNVSPDCIEQAITEKTKAIIPVHLTGRPAQMNKIIEIANDNNLKIIEDCAQAINANINGKKVGSFGDTGAFSLHPLKNLNACGDAGFITTNNDEISSELRQLRNIGLKNRDESDIWGINSRLDELQAAILLVKLKYLPEWEKKRRENAAFYHDGLKDIVKAPIDDAGMYSVYHTYVIQADDRDGLSEYLAKEGIETKIHYPIPIHLQKASEIYGYRKGMCPVVEEQANKILSISVYPELTEEERHFIVLKIKEFYGENI